MNDRPDAPFCWVGKDVEVIVRMTVGGDGRRGPVQLGAGALGGRLEVVNEVGIGGRFIMASVYQGLKDNLPESVGYRFYPWGSVVYMKSVEEADEP